MILTHRADLAVPTFHIKLLFPRVPKSLAANPECSEIHKGIKIFPETFLIVNLPDECLENYTMRRGGIEKSGSEKATAIKTFTLEQGEKSRRQKLS